MILSHVKLWQIDIMAFDLWGQGDQKYENQLQPTFLEFGSGDSWVILCLSSPNFWPSRPLNVKKMEVKVQKLISLGFYPQ